MNKITSRISKIETPWESIYNLIHPYLFRLDPERMYDLTLHALSLAGNVAPARWFLSQLFKEPVEPVEAFGLTFKNPVGIAAGYDKDRIAIREISLIRAIRIKNDF